MPSCRVDIDPDTLGVAEANARLNRSRARFSCADFGAGEAGDPYDVVVANLIAEGHVDLMDAYGGVVRPGGTLILSGIVDDRVAMVLEAVRPPFAVVDRAHAGTWWALRLVHEAVSG